MTQTITPYLLYADCEAALDFLARAFGAEEVLRYTGPEGYISHAETRIAGGSVYMGDPGDDYRGPREVGETVGIYVMVDDVDAVYERARGAGAEIVSEPVDQEYGHRSFSARDPEGHRWYFAQEIAAPAAEEWGAEVPA